MSVPFYAARKPQELVKELVSKTPKLAALVATQSHARRAMTLENPCVNGANPVEFSSVFSQPSPVEEWLARPSNQLVSNVIEAAPVSTSLQVLNKGSMRAEGYSARIDQSISLVYQKYGMRTNHTQKQIEKKTEAIVQRQEDDEVVFDERISERELLRLACMIVRVAFPQYVAEADRGKFFSQVLSQLKVSANTLPGKKPVHSIAPLSRRAIIASVIYGATNHYYGVLKAQKPSLFHRSHELTRRMVSAVAGTAGSGEALNYFKSDTGSFHPARLTELENHKALVTVDHMSPSQLKHQLFVASAKKSRLVEAIYANNKDGQELSFRNHWQDQQTEKMMRLLQSAQPTNSPQQLAATFDRPSAY